MVTCWQRFTISSRMFRRKALRGVWRGSEPKKMNPRLLIALALLAAPLCPQDSGPHLWAVSDSVRVNPVTGQIFEARPDLHKDYPAPDFRNGNSVWKPGSKTVSLKAARNEFVAFQVIVDSPSPASDVDTKFANLTGPNGAVIEGHNVAVFKEWYVEVRRATTGYERSSLGPGWYPDALMPRRPAGLHSGFPFSIPDLFNNIPDQRNQALWVDIYVPFERGAAPPGRYTGELAVSWKGGADSIHVALDVWDFVLPHENHLSGDIWNDSLREMPPEQELAYYQLARQHRFLPLVYGYRPKLKLHSSDVSLDWTEYDRRLAAYLDGSAFTSAHGYWGPGYGLPVDHADTSADQGRHVPVRPTTPPRIGPTNTRQMACTGSSVDHLLSGGAEYPEAVTEVTDKGKYPGGFSR